MIVRKNSKQHGFILNVTITYVILRDDTITETKYNTFDITITNKGIATSSFTIGDYCIDGRDASYYHRSNVTSFTINSVTII